MLPTPHHQQRLRQQRLRVLAELEARLKSFLKREELWPLRVPRQPLSLERIVADALRDVGGTLQPQALRSRSLLRLEWADGSAWEVWVLVLPSGLKLYCDTSDEESRVLASGGRNEGSESDRVFLELLAESAGNHFGIEMSGGAPRRVRSPLADRAFLVEFFVNLFEVTGAEASVTAQLAARQSPDGAGHDFRDDVDQWLQSALGR